jgi:hypothetical protein
MTDHPEDQGPIPQRAEPEWIVNHFEKPVSLREHLHSSLDRLLTHMEQAQETQGLVSITVLDAEGAWAGHTVALAVDLNPHKCGPECPHDDGA